MGKRKKINQRTEGLYPSTINKVHHDEGGSQKPLPKAEVGRSYHHYPRGWWIVLFSQHDGCQALLIALFLQYYGTFSCKEKKKKYLVGLAEGVSQNPKNLAGFDEYVMISRMLGQRLFFHPLPSEESGKQVFLNITLAHDTSKKQNSSLRGVCSSGLQVRMENTCYHISGDLTVTQLWGPSTS